MIRSEMITFGGGQLDRAAHLRAQSEALALDPRARFAVMWHGKPLVWEDRSGLVLLAPGHRVVASDLPRVFLGLDAGAPRFAVDLSAWAPEGQETVTPGTPGFSDPSEQRHPDVEKAVFAELRAVMTTFDAMQAELVATAKSILSWHRSHRFCSNCGAESHRAEAGWLRQCPDCGTRHFPRTDPVVIMLVTHGNRLLLGRSPGWPEGMYSLLAGFAEPGETIEAATRREVYEEAGVRLGDVTYLACQPWPYPSSLMIATRAEALSDALTLDPQEIEDAIWLTREQVLDVHAGTHSDILPARKGAIAEFIIRNWLADTLNRAE